MDRESIPQPSRQSLRALDALNFFLADVQGGVGPFLAIILTATYHWSPADVGIAMSAAGVATVAAQTPMGALIDALRQKRLLVVLASMLISIGCVGMALYNSVFVIVGAQTLLGVAGAVFPPAVAGVSLGLVGHSYMDRRTGRNQSFNHIGNVVTVALAGLLGQFIGSAWIFYTVAIMGVASIISVSRVRAAEIDYDRARGAIETKGNKEQVQISGFKTLITDRRLLALGAAFVLFHLGNAAMLPLAGQKLSEGNSGYSSLFMSAAIIIAQTAMIAVAWWSGRASSWWGRKPVFLIAFIALPIRGLLFALSSNPAYLLSVQVLDGVGAGIFGVMSIIMIADLTQGTGRFNVTQGVLATAVGIGASMSNLLGEFVLGAAGFDAAFVVLASTAVVGLAVFWLFVPETKALGSTEPALEIAA
jgi:MFS family permease